MDILGREDGKALVKKYRHVNSAYPEKELRVSSFTSSPSQKGSGPAQSTPSRLQVHEHVYTGLDLFTITFSSR